MQRLRALAVLLGPSAVLVPVLWIYVQFDGTPHFVLHTLTGWAVALLLLLWRSYRGRAPARWDGLVLLGLAAWAMTPDLIYRFGPAHRDWMDVFLFHVSLDEILPAAVVFLAGLVAVLLAAHARFRSPPGAAGGLRAGDRSRSRLVLAATTSAFVALVGFAMVTERTTQTPLLRVGQSAPDFALPATDGQVRSLAEFRGQTVLLGFVPSVLCGFCREQLRTFQQALPQLRNREVVVLVVSTDTEATQRAIEQDLDLDYPLLSEAPTVGQHPVGSAYGVYHLHPGPVDTNAVFVIDGTGIIRAVRVEPGRALAPPELFALVAAAGVPR